MQKIDDLQLEIKSFKSEIASLQQELSANSQIAPKAVSNSPEAIADAFRSAAVATHERIADIQGIRGAIAELESRLNQKQSQLQELEKQHQKQARVKRVEIAQQKLREQIERVDDIASLLESAYLELKAIYKEANPDFKALGSAAPGSYSYQLHQLINFDFLRVPVLIEKSGAFTLGSRTINLFEAEQKAAKDEQLARSRENRLYQEQLWAGIKQKEVQEKLRVEREYRASLLVAKQQELKDFVQARAERLVALKTADVGGFDSAIAKLEAEIENLEKPMQT